MIKMLMYCGMPEQVSFPRIYIITKKLQFHWEYNKKQTFYCQELFMSGVRPIETILNMPLSEQTPTCIFHNCFHMAEL